MTKFRKLTTFAFLIPVGVLTIFLAIVWFSPATHIGRPIEGLLEVPRSPRFPTASALCSTEPMPPYAAVYPEPEQIVSMSSESQTTVTESDEPYIMMFNISVTWEPGFVCVMLDAGHLLEPGDFWELADVIAKSSMLLNGQRLEMAPMVVDGIVTHERIFCETADDGTARAIVKASVGGPYGMCWEGPWEEGIYVARFTFEEHSYSWWYRIEE